MLSPHACTEPLLTRCRDMVEHQLRHNREPGLVDPPPSPWLSAAIRTETWARSPAQAIPGEWPLLASEGYLLPLRAQIEEGIEAKRVLETATQLALLAA